MDLRYSKEEQAFRDEVRTFLAENLPEDIRRRMIDGDYGNKDDLVTWSRILNAKGWAVPHWPKEYGGTGWDPMRQYIFLEETQKWPAPQPLPFGVNMVGPVIYTFGNEAQKAHYLPRIANLDDWWCQGFSEPGAGSDLASLRTRAVRDGDHYVVNGHKTWTSVGHEANMMFCLVRTDGSGKKQEGITFLLIDMHSPGITVRPIIMASGEHIQNQIFFDEVRVPVANVLGEIDDGWTVAKYLLTFERGGSAYAPALQVALEELQRDIADQPENPMLNARIAEARIRCDVLNQLESDLRSRLSAGESTGADSSMLKILGTELEQCITELALEAAGPAARAFQPGVAMPGGPIPAFAGDDYCTAEVWQALAPLRYLNHRAGTIYAGTNEIQRNILAKAELRI